MFTLLRSNATGFDNGKMSSFISFIFSFIYMLFNRVFYIDVIPGSCGI